MDNSSNNSNDTSSQVKGTISGLSTPPSTPPSQSPISHSFYGELSPKNNPPPQTPFDPLSSEEETPLTPSSPPQEHSPLPPPPSSPPLPGENPPPPLMEPPRSIPWGPIIAVLLFLLGIGLLFLLVTRVILPMFNTKPEAVTLTYWGLWEEPRVMQSLFDDFTKEYPHITVKYSRQDIKDYRQRLSARIPLGNGPDVFRYHNTWYPMLSKELSPFPKNTIDPQSFQTNYFPVVQQDSVKGGAVYGIPLGVDTLALFVNTEILEASGQPVPTTWDEFIKVAKVVTVKDQEGKIQTAGAGLGTYDNITHAPDIVSLIMLQNGTDFANLAQTKEKASEALTFYTAFARDTNNVWDSSLEPSLTLFTQGKLAMYLGYSWDIFQIKELNKDLKFSTHPVPNLPGKSLTVASYWLEGVSSKSTHQEEGFLLMNFLQRKETLQKFYAEAAKVRLFGELYPRSDLSETLRDNKLVYPFLLQSPSAVSTPFVADTYDNGLNDQLNGYMGNAVRSVLQATSPESAVDTLSNGVSQVLGQYGQ